MGVRKNERDGGVGARFSVARSFLSLSSANAYAGGFPCQADFLRAFVTFLGLRARDEAQRLKHGAIGRNIVGCYILHTLLHVVVCCWHLHKV